MKTTRYITVDVVLKTNDECDALMKTFADRDDSVDKCEWNKQHKWHVCISLMPHDDAESCIYQFCKDLESFPQDARDEWDRAATKEFFIGYDIGDQPHCYAEHLSSKVIQLVASLGGGIGLALYPARNEEE